MYQYSSRHAYRDATLLTYNDCFSSSIYLRRVACHSSTVLSIDSHQPTCKRPTRACFHSSIRPRSSFHQATYKPLCHGSCYLSTVPCSCVHLPMRTLPSPPYDPTTMSHCRNLGLPTQICLGRASCLLETILKICSHWSICKYHDQTEGHLPNGHCTLLLRNG